MFNLKNTEMIAKIEDVADELCSLYYTQLEGHRGIPFFREEKRRIFLWIIDTLYEKYKGDLNFLNDKPGFKKAINLEKNNLKKRRIQERREKFSLEMRELHRANIAKDIPLEVEKPLEREKEILFPIFVTQEMEIKGETFEQKNKRLGLSD